MSETESTLSSKEFELLKIAVDLARDLHVRSRDQLRERMLSMYPTQQQAIDRAIERWAQYANRPSMSTAVSVIEPYWLNDRTVVAPPADCKLYLTQNTAEEAALEYRIPRKSEAPLLVNWIGDGEIISIHGRTFTDPCVWICAAMPFAGQTERGIIYPELAVRRSDLNIRPQPVLHDRDYFSFTREQRAEYLDWLVEGGDSVPRDPGFAFEYFCGLERFVLEQLAALHPDVAQLGAVLAKLRSLASSLSNTRSSGLHHAHDTQFLSSTIAGLSQLVQLRLGHKKFYDQAFILTNARWEVPLDLRIALGQLAADGVPMPANIALAWYWYSVPSRSAVIERCQVEFARLFEARYDHFFPKGFHLRVNRTPLEFPYHPIESRRRRGAIGWCDLPDVTAQKKPIEQLTIYGQALIDELAPLSRLLAKDPEARNSVAMIACAPIEAWSDRQLERVAELRARVAEGVLAIKWGELRALFGNAHDLTPARFASFSQNLEAAGLVIIRHVSHKWPVPRDDDLLVLVADSPQANEKLEPAQFTTALLAVHVGAWLAHQDRQLEATEIRSLHGMIAQWPALAAGQARRLKGHLRALMDAAPSLNHIKQSAKSIERSDVERAAIAVLGSLYRQRDCNSEEMKHLQTAYTAIGLFTDLASAHLHRVRAGETDAGQHSASSQTRGMSSTKGNRSYRAVLQLNPDLVAAMQEESAAVAAMLHDVFAEPELDAQSLEGTLTAKGTAPQASSESPSTVQKTLASQLPNLDDKVLRFAHALADNRSWSRSALVPLAQAHGVMLDGALEAINEAAYEHHGFPFGEGEDPFELSPEFLDLLNVDTP